MIWLPKIRCVKAIYTLYILLEHKEILIISYINNAVLFVYLFYVVFRMLGKMKNILGFFFVWLQVSTIFWWSTLWHLWKNSVRKNWLAKTFRPSCKVSMTDNGVFLILYNYMCRVHPRGRHGICDLPKQFHFSFFQSGRSGFTIKGYIERTFQKVITSLQNFRKESKLLPVSKL